MPADQSFVPDAFGVLGIVDSAKNCRLGGESCEFRSPMHSLSGKLKRELALRVISRIAFLYLSTCSLLAVAQGTVESELKPILSKIRQTGKLTTEDVVKLEQLKKAAPSNRQISKILAQIYVQREDWNAIIKMMQSAPADQRDAKYEAELGKVLILAQRFREASELLLPRVESGETENVEAIWNAAYSTFHSSDRRIASRLLEIHLESLVAAKRHDALLLLADCRFREGKAVEAQQLLKRLLKLKEDNAPAHDMLGRILNATGEIELAKVHAQRATEIRNQNRLKERTAFRLAAMSQALNAAWERKDFKTCEKYIDKMMPKVDTEQQSKLYKFIAAIRQEQGRIAEAKTALDKAKQLASKVKKKKP